MRVILSPEKTEINSHKHISDIKMFHDSVLESECTDLICDNFISTFDYNEIDQIIQILTSKMRLNSELTIKEVDARLVCKKFHVEELDLDAVNSILFSTKRKSMLTSDKITSLINNKLTLSSVHYDDKSCSSIIKYRRSL